MKGLAGQNTVAWAMHKLTDIAGIGVGRSERGIGVQVYALNDWEADADFEGATVYLSDAEVEELITKLRDALKGDRRGRVPVPR